MSGFTDYHAHFVYGVDDGARTREEMFAMLDAAAADGVTRLFATSHSTPGMEPFPRDVYIERYPRLARSGALPRLKEQYGIRCQVNADTVLEGGFFQRRKLDRWLKDGLVDAISSDAHNCTTRATRMQAAYERLCGILGQPDADALTGRNNALLLTP